MGTRRRRCLIVETTVSGSISNFHELPSIVIPASAGIQGFKDSSQGPAGMTLLTDNYKTILRRWRRGAESEGSCGYFFLKTPGAFGCEFDPTAYVKRFSPREERFKSLFDRIKI